MRILMTFQDLEQTWQEQAPAKHPLSSEEVATKAKASLRQMRTKQTYTLIILGVTCLILAGFYIYIEAYNDLWSGLGILVMLLSLVLRMGLEVYHNQKLKNIDPTQDQQTFLQQHQSYFKQRQWVHFGFTPLVYLLYFWGFWQMLPAFKANLSSGFYTYILISGSLVFIGLAVFIGYHIKKELRDLRFFEELISK